MVVAPPLFFMDRNLLVKLFGFPVTLIHGDPMVLDRWGWLKARLPITNKNLKLLDVGCGSGAFSIGLALRGYSSLGLCWNERDRNEASIRAELCKVNNTRFDLQDVRFLEGRKDLFDNFDVVICLECIEHILNDQKLINDMSGCLRKFGRLLLTAPNYYISLGLGDNKNLSISQVEDGGHVRVGYTEEDLRRLCKNAGLEIDEIGYCSGFLSQKLTALQRVLSKINPMLAWVFVLPLRPIPVICDKYINRLLRWRGYSICLVAHKI